MSLEPDSHIHFVGIGGFGLSAIAKVMLEEGYRISGCDLAESPLAKKLRKRGVTISVGHDPAHVEMIDGVGRPDALVVSSAVPDDNPELVAARAANIPVYKRADVLGELMSGRTGVAIAGTHGKTTTTAMTAYVLTQAGLDPTYIVGGVILNTGTNAHAGRGKPFVVEADEYDRMFMGLRPSVAVVTSIEHDHPDKFPSLHDVTAAFEDFVGLLPDDGPLIACYDDPQARLLAEKRRKAGLPVVTYGLSHGADLRALELMPNMQGGSDFIVKQGLMLKGLVRLRLPGAHNVQNCLAVLILAEHLGVQFELVAAVISEFEGTERRFEIKGEIGGVTAIDDYAHHPTAVRATLDSARRRYGNSTLWAVFQPHTFTRTKALLDEFSTAFDEAEHVIVTDIYRARETDDLGISSKALVKAMDHPDARHIGKLDAVVDFLADAVEPGDVVITMSAGDATRIGDDLLDALAKRFADDSTFENAASIPGRDMYEDAAVTSGIVRRLLMHLRKEDAARDGKPPDY